MSWTIIGKCWSNLAGRTNHVVIIWGGNFRRSNLRLFVVDWLWSNTSKYLLLEPVFFSNYFQSKIKWFLRLRLITQTFILNRDFLPQSLCYPNILRKIYNSTLKPWKITKKNFEKLPYFCFDCKLTWDKMNKINLQVLTKFCFG